jgi:bacillithiol biosynthesis cysteine-adding enzyme BshC
MSDTPHASPVHPCRSIQFTEIPRTSALFLDYLYAPDRVARFYEHRWEGVESLARLAPSIAAAHGDREQLADALAHQNRSYGASALALEHVELLRRPESVAVVTGQQAGLFGGPLFTVHKALTAITLAARLRARGVIAVPVFWIASEDHDFDEVDHVTVLNRAGALETLRSEACALEPDMPVGHVALCAEITRTVDTFFAALPETNFTKKLHADLAESYAPGVGFAEGFARWMARLFAAFGVVLLDPLAPALKELASPTYLKAIERAPEIAAALVDRSRELVEAGYHAQVFTSPDMMTLFIMEGQRRRAMMQRDGRFALKSGERAYEPSELLDLAENCATCLSPNVTLRPAVQDTLLPTVAYIGGPAEVAYFAQLQPVYHIVGSPMPIIVPRASVTLLDHDSDKTLARYGICLEDFFEGPEAVLRKAVERSLDAPTAALFDEVEGGLGGNLERLREALGRAEPTLAVSLDGSRRKMLYQLNKLRTRFVRAAGNRDAVLHRRLAAAEALLYPNRGLQERTLNVIYYLAQTGYGLVDDLAANLDPESRAHQIIDLGGVASQVFVRGSGVGGEG